MTYVIAQPCVDVKDRACVDECPVDCIYEGSRSLYINPNECVDCGACEPVCPTEAIRFGFDPARNKIGMAVVDSEECLLYRSGSGRCSKECIDACTYEALSVDDSGYLRVDVDACNGCGACEHAFPSSSYGSYTGSSRRGINIEAWGGDAS